jgi:hypothetical protein
MRTVVNISHKQRVSTAVSKLRCLNEHFYLRPAGLRSCHWILSFSSHQIYECLFVGQYLMVALLSLGEINMKKSIVLFHTANKLYSTNIIIALFTNVANNVSWITK